MGWRDFQNDIHVDLMDNMDNMPSSDSFSPYCPYCPGDKDFENVQDSPLIPRQEAFRMIVDIFRRLNQGWPYDFESDWAAQDRVAIAAKNGMRIDFHKAIQFWEMRETARAAEWRIGDENSL